MYNSPIEMIIGNMQIQQEGEIFRAVQNIGVNVDKDELLKALQYDREQYEKGYKDGIKEFAKFLIDNAEDRVIDVSDLPDLVMDFIEKELENDKN